MKIGNNGSADAIKHLMDNGVHRSCFQQTEPIASTAINTFLMNQKMHLLLHPNANTYASALMHTFYLASHRINPQTTHIRTSKEWKRLQLLMKIINQHCYIIYNTWTAMKWHLFNSIFFATDAAAAAIVAPFCLWSDLSLRIVRANCPSKLSTLANDDQWRAVQQTMNDYD